MLPHEARGNVTFPCRERQPAPQAEVVMVDYTSASPRLGAMPMAKMLLGHLERAFAADEESQLEPIKIYRSEELGNPVIDGHHRLMMTKLHPGRKVPAVIGTTPEELGIPKNIWKSLWLPHIEESRRKAIANGIKTFDDLYQKAVLPLYI